MIPNVSIDAQSGDIETEQSDEDFLAEVNSAKDTLLADNEAEISSASPVYDGILSTSSLKEAIPSFEWSNGHSGVLLSDDIMDELVKLM
jgi:hypothetical protein